MADALEEYGYAHVTVARVLERAGVSRRTFYEQFKDKDDCFLAAYDDAEGRVWAHAAEAIPGLPAGNWPMRVHAAVGTVSDFLATEPATARLFTLEARAAGPAIAERHQRALDHVAAVLRAGNRTRLETATDLPEVTERDAGRQRSGSGRLIRPQRGHRASAQHRATARGSSAPYL